MKTIGARFVPPAECHFRVWAPFRRKVDLILHGPALREIPLKKTEDGYWECSADDAPAGTRYSFRLDNGRPLPDPASHFQPQGVHKASALVDHAGFQWTDRDWKGVDLDRMVFYEMHTGTFTPEGTFDAAVKRMPELAGLGVTAIEVMPVAQFPGARNWGYDGACPFAVQDAYGGPAGLKRFVNACHGAGLSVFLDVVYNHLGPEGNYLGEYGPYFTDRYRTPWGRAVNLDGEHSGPVRDFFIDNALYWLDHFHIDGLRLDAVHGLYDTGARHFLAELSDAVGAFSLSAGRKRYLIAESDLNDPRVVRSAKEGGHGLDSQWSDDFHHALHTLLTGERSGYYEDFGSLAKLARAHTQGFVYGGDYSTHRKRRHGAPGPDLPCSAFTVFCQNHDQTGNRMNGERLIALAGLEPAKLAAACTLLSPFVPLLFMGEEYGEEAPFLYFVSHSDPGLVQAVREGRKNEFKSFAWQGEVPDPQDEATFRRSRLQWKKAEEGQNGRVRDFYRELLLLRGEYGADTRPAARAVRTFVCEKTGVLAVLRETPPRRLLNIMNFSRTPAGFDAGALGFKGVLRLDSAHERFGGPGSGLPPRIAPGQEIRLMPKSSAVYQEEGGSA